MTSLLRLAVASVVVGSSIAVLGGCNQDGSSGATDRRSAASSPMPVPSGLASVTISWLPPDTNVNGTVLTDLAGYRIHYGTNSAALGTQIDIPTSGMTDYVVENLAPDTTYYFAVSAYNSAGVESNYSPVVSVTTS